jgi:hypothetical protein
MSNSVEDLYSIFGRVGCAQDALNSLVESYFQYNIVIQVNNDY